ncbi:iron chelate uptake ABC transporter family permease subunit [Rhodobacteraceae bacterium NNCM2]|nr:iron chelate uptake ABC transporter family permease subunit [Coraliihabitans acroporae]
MVTAALLALAAICMIAFLTIGARGSWTFVLSFRGERLAALVLVACAVAMSTVLFQTLTQNRILTPSIMGFDALFALIQTVMVFAFGSAAVSGAHPWLIFGVELALMGGGAALLFRWLFDGATRSLHLLMLVGIVIGVLFRSITGFLQRLIDPGEFLVLQDRLFASFGSVESDLLGLSALLIVGAAFAVIPLLPALDVLTLGRENAIMLGVNHRRLVGLVFGLVTLLVAVSTALVGPVTFFGLMVANLAYLLVPGAGHAKTLCVAALIAVICLVGGQTLLERILAFDGTLGMVVELLGGITLILLLIRGMR